MATLAKNRSRGAASALGSDSERSSYAADAAQRLLRSAERSPSRVAYAARALSALNRLIESSEEATLIEATGAPTDYEVLVHVLQQPLVLEALRQRDPLAPARLRGLRARARLLAAEGGTLTAQEMASLLGITRQAVDLRRKRGKLLAVQLGEHAFAYPVWQLGSDGPLPGFAAVLAAIDQYDPWMQLGFFLGSNDVLDSETPLNALRRGDLDRVLLAAELFGEHTAS